MPFLALLLTSLAINAALYLLTGLITPERKVESEKPEFPTADPDRYLPYVFGTVRLPLNIFRAAKINVYDIKKKRLFFGISIGKEDTIGHAYRFTLMAWLCHGPLSGICDIIIDGKKFMSRQSVQRKANDPFALLGTDSQGNPINLVGIDYVIGPATTGTLIWFLGQWPNGAPIFVNAPGLFGDPVVEGGVDGIIRTYPGDGSHLPNPTIAAINAIEYPGYDEPTYPEYAYVVLEDFLLGNSPHPPGVEMVVSRASTKMDFGNPLMGYPSSPFGNAHNGFAQGDANPVGVIYELLINRKIGIGIPRALIDAASFDVAWIQTHDATFGSEHFGISGVVMQPDEAETTIQEVLRHIDAILFMDPSTGLITFRLIRAFGGDPMGLPVLDETNLTSLTWTEQAANNNVNELRVEFTNVYRDLQTDVVKVQNLAAIQKAGRINSETVQFPYITLPDLAAKVGQRELRAQSSNFGRGEFAGNRQLMLMTPGQHVRVNWPSLGLVNKVCRIGAIDAGSLRDGTVSGTVIEDIFETSAPSYNVELPPPLPIPESPFIPPTVDVNIAGDYVNAITYNLVITDLSASVTAVEYALQVGNGPVGSWVLDPSYPYVYEVLKDGINSFRAWWRVTYTDANGDTQYLTDEFPQPVSTVKPMPTPRLTYEYVGTDVVVTATIDDPASEVIFASAIGSVPSDSTVAAGTVDSSAPFTYTTPAPTGSSVLYVGALASDGMTNSAVVRLPIPPKPTSVAGAEVLLNGSDASFPAGRDVNDSATIAWDFSVANLALASVKDNSLGIAKLSATGTRDATTFLRGDDTFSPIPAFPGPGGAMQVYQTIVKTTGTLADGASQILTLEIAPTVAFQKVEVSAASWVEVYCTGSACSADAARAITVDPDWSSPNKPIFETAGGLAGYPLTTEIDFDNPVANNGDTPRVGRFYMRVTNKSGASAAITVTITYLPLEGDPATTPVDVGGAGMYWRFDARQVLPAPADGTETLTVPNTGALGGSFISGSSFGSGPKYKVNIFKGGTLPALRVAQIGGNTRAYSFSGTLPSPSEIHVFSILKTAGGGAAYRFGGDRTAFPNAAGNVSGWAGSNAEHLVPIVNDPTQPFLFYEHGVNGLYEAHVGLDVRLSTTTNTFAISQDMIGGHLAGGFLADVFAGDLGEIRVYGGVLSPDDVLGIKMTMASDWGVSL